MSHILAYSTLNIPNKHQQQQDAKKKHGFMTGKYDLK